MTADLGSGIPVAAIHVINLLTYILLGTVLAIVATKKLNRAVTWLTIQSLFLAAVGGVTAMTTGVADLYLAALLTAGIKGLAIPAVLFYVIRRIGVQKELELVVSTKTSLVITGALMVLAYSVIPSTLVSAAMGPNVLPVAVALMMSGLLLMVTRKKAITQVVGLMVMENGLYLAAMATTHGMPLIVELGIFLDLLVGALIMGILAFKINQTFDTINTDRLTNLKG